MLKHIYESFSTFYISLEKWRNLVHKLKLVSKKLYLYTMFAQLEIVEIFRINLDI